MIGKTLGHYEITSQLGKGGMGEVYQAKDSKLGRDVAIKVLPEEFANDAARVARFQREAKLLASLNHPNIAAIYGLEESGDTNFLVLELVEGETLTDRIKAGPIPVEEGLKLALQIAEALEAAHERGVIHRDLKPANIKVTPDGKVKVLDFGLAKAFAGEQEQVMLSNSPTLSVAATQQGIILGTAAYMAPEQARGESVDKRADIWAFGVVLFEMLTGRVTFEGRTVSDVLASVIKSEPEWKRLPPNLHPRIRLLFERCLEKEAKSRYGVIGDARVDIQKALADPAGVFAQPINGGEPRTRLRTILPWAAAALVLGLIIAGVAVWKLKPSQPGRVMRFDYELAEGQQLSSGPSLAVSPDGYRYVYGTSTGLYLRSMGELDARLIPGSDANPRQPFFSPDGQWIGYWASNNNQLKKISVSGGASVLITAANNPLGPTWGADDSIVYSQLGKGIMRISANGGVPQLLVESQDMMLSFPQLLPDGRTVVFTQNSQIAVQSLKTRKRKILFEGSLARYAPSGHLVYALQNGLYAIGFNLSTLETVGGPVPILQGIRQTALAVPLYAFSDSGTLIYAPGSSAFAAKRSLVWVDRSGKEEPLAAAPNSYMHPRISPDGTRIALTIMDPANVDIWIWDLVREAMTRLTFDEATDFSPLWTPDGKRIAFASIREKRADVCWKPADGTGQAEPLGSVPGKVILPSCWSGDGNNMLLEEMSGFGSNATLGAFGVYLGSILQTGQALAPGGTTIGIDVLTMKNERAWKSLLRDKYFQSNPQVSPDGRWLAYFSNESGRMEVYVRPFPNVNGGKWQVSTNGGNQPRWSKNGKELFYRSGDAVMAVAVETEPAFKAGVPEMLFRGTYYSLVGQMWDISPDGKRFLMVKNESAGETSAGRTPVKINIVLNWLEELKQKVPVK